MQHDGWIFAIGWRRVSCTLAPAGCDKSITAAHEQRQCRNYSAHFQQSAGMLRFACALAAIGISLALAQASEIVLHNFASPPKGAYPTSGVIRDSAGNLYGTTSNGGRAGYGVVYKVDSVGHETVLYSFTGGLDGSLPYAGVIGDSAGNLYGTTNGGGTAGYGVVYKLDRNRHETVLYNFTGGNDGGYPYAGVIRDAAGNLYGTTNGGGPAYLGVVFMLDASGQETALYGFTGGVDGCDPWTGVVADSTGNLYGSTTLGGPANQGVVYKLDATGHETVLYSFEGGEDGSIPSGVVPDSAGNLFGTTKLGGTAGAGVVYKLDATGHKTVLYSFTGGADGGTPVAGVIRDSAGNLYGTTVYGGTAGAGVVYKVDATGHETVLHSFTGGADGGYPYAGVIRDSAGNLYGTTLQGGTASLGVVYKVDATGHETVLYSFKRGADGAGPNGVIRDSAGNLYGTTQTGGAKDWGVVYKLDTTGQETLLYSFRGGADGGEPSAGVIRDSAGNLYGTTSYGGGPCPNGCGVVYKVDTSGHETVLYTFTGGADGANPYAGVIRDSAGNLYGTTSQGGASKAGVVFALTGAATAQ
jgi:uncharacterized repeat protein (TIGR03803 family)